MLRTALLLVLLAATPVWGATARGTVFEDLNANGVLDEGEPGIANVRVSNGRDVVLTGSGGEYALRLPAETIIFITKPAGYRTPVNGHQLPQFYYIHQPDGSPGGLHRLRRVWSVKPVWGECVGANSMPPVVHRVGNDAHERN